MAVTSLPGAPTTRLSFGRLAAINAFWFGGGAHWQPIYISLIPVGATLIAGSRADLLIGRVTAAGGIFALFTPILVGWLSDRTATRWGRRRPWMVAGTALNVIGLGLLALSASELTFIAAYLVVQISNNAAGAAYTGVIPDVVRAEDRGRASGLLGTMNQLGTVVGVGLVGVTFKLFGDTRNGLLAGYGVVVLILVVTLLITLIAVKEPRIPKPAPRPFRAREDEDFPIAAVVCAAALSSPSLRCSRSFSCPLAPFCGRSSPSSWRVARSRFWQRAGCRRCWPSSRLSARTTSSGPSPPAGWSPSGSFPSFPSWSSTSATSCAAKMPVLPVPSGCWR
jgi:MFS family permease